MEVLDWPELHYVHPVTREPTDPLPWQQRFHAYRKQGVRGRLAGGAFGAGKSLALVMDGLAVAMDYPGTRIAFVRETLVKVKETTFKVFHQDVLGVEDARELKHHPWIAYWNLSEHWGRMTNGTEIWFQGTRESGGGKSGARSKVFGAIYYDEMTEISEAAWGEWDARLRHPLGPRQWAGATNPEPNWVKDRFHPMSRNRVSNVAFIQTRSADNFYLPEGYVEDLKKSGRPETWIQRFLEGSWDVFEGQVYTDWDARLHANWLFDVPAPGVWREWGAMDYGFTNPTVFLTFGQDYDDRVFVFGEHYQRGWRPSQHVDVVMPTYKARGVQIVYGCKGAFMTESNGTKPADEYARAGLFLTRAKEGIGGGIERIKRFLATPDKFHVHPSCVETIREFPAQRYKDLTPGREDYLNVPEDPIDKDNHCMEAVRHGLDAADWGGLDRPEKPEDLLAAHRKRLIERNERRQGASGRRAW